MADRHSEKGSLIDRRTVLRLTGAAAAAAVGTSAFSGTTVAASAPSTTVNLGNEGLTTGDDITPYLEEFCVDGNEVRIPEGTYEWDGSNGIDGSYGGPMWLVGEGKGATLDVGDGGQVSVDIIAEAAGAHVRLQNLTQTGVLEGESDLDVAARHPDALIEFVRVDRPDGCADGANANGTYVDDAHAGVMRFVDCYYEGFSNNGIYASSPGQPADEGGEGGRVEVLGGLYKNCDVCCVRIGSDSSRVEGVTVVQDAHAAGISGGNAQRGIRIREGGSDMVIHDCDITVEEFDGASAAIQVADENFYNPGGNLTITNTRIRNEIGAPVVSTQASDWPASGENIKLTGSGSYDLEGDGPYTGVCTGSNCEQPTKKRRRAPSATGSSK